MHFINKATDLNNKGVALLESGMQHEAFECFTYALENLSRLAQYLQSQAFFWKQQQQADHNASSVQLCRRKRQSYLLQQSEILEKVAFSQKACEIGFSRETFLYNQSFRFNPVQLFGFDEDFCSHFVNFYTAILTFNCALSFHQRSDGVDLELKRTAESYASQLYFEAMEHLRKCYATVDSSIVLTATLNNAAMICYGIHDFEQFCNLQEELHRLLIDTECSFPHAVDTCCMLFFYFNATMLSAPQTAGAA